MKHLPVWRWSPRSRFRRRWPKIRANPGGSALSGPQTCGSAAISARLRDYCFGNVRESSALPPKHHRTT